jgi:hypothetical protein|nr:hypothetical protein RTCK_00216 [Rhizobium sp. TCK]
MGWLASNTFTRGGSCRTNRPDHTLRIRLVDMPARLHNHVVNDDFHDGVGAGCNALRITALLFDGLIIANSSLRQR